MPLPYHELDTAAIPQMLSFELNVYNLIISEFSVS